MAIKIQGTTIINDQNAYIDLAGTTAVKVPTGNTFQQPTGVAGMLRFNSESISFEGYDGSDWGPVEAGDYVSRVDDTDLEAGYTITAKNDGTKSSGTYTPNPSDANMITITNGGAFTLAAPTATGAYTIVILITNNASAGAITLSGFTKTSGDNFTTTNSHKFFVFITKIGSTVHAQVQELQ